MITHNEEIAQLADRVIRIEDGKIRSDGPIWSEKETKKDGGRHA